MATAVVKLSVDATEFDAFVERATSQLEAIGQACRDAGVKIGTKPSYFIGADDSGHRYLVPLNRRHEWLAWCELPGDDPASWTEPDYAVRFEGELLTFEDPKLEGVPLDEYAVQRWGKKS